MPQRKTKIQRLQAPQRADMTNQGIDIQHPKLRGEWAELRFMARAAEHGLRVSKPFGDCAPYDATVEHDGHFFRIQIKSTKSQKKGSHSYACDLRRRDTKPYTTDDIDFFAIYIIPCDLWYIFPADVAVAATNSVVLSPDLPNSKHAPYKEAWHLLCNALAQDHKGTAAEACPEPSQGECPPEPIPAAELPAHPDATLHPSHPFHHAEAGLLAVRDRLQNNPFRKPRR